MQEVIKITNGRYKEYEAMLLERDYCLKQADLCYKNYIHEFGELLTRIFQSKVSCIEKKKIIAMCQKFINRGEPIDFDDVKKQISAEMTEYRQQLEHLIEQKKMYQKKFETVSEKTLENIKQIYRRVARQLHPDINPITTDSPVLSDLWNRVSVAYKCNRIEDLKELEVLVGAALNSLGKQIECDIPNLEDKIKKLVAEIEKIKTTEPYIYEKIFQSQSSINRKKSELRAELESCECYEKELQNIITEEIRNNKICYINPERTLAVVSDVGGVYCRLQDWALYEKTKKLL